MRLGAPVRGVVHGFALIISPPVAWQAGEQKAALFIGAVAVFRIGLEAVRNGRKGDR